MVDAKKMITKKAEEEKAGEEQKGDEQAQDDQAEDDQVGALVCITNKEKPDLQLSTSSHSLASNYGNQFLNNSSDISLIGTILENTDAKINSLLDIQIQQEIPTIQQEPLHDVKVLVFLDPATLPPTPPPTPKEAPVFLVPESEAFAAGLQRSPELGNQVTTLKQADHSEFILESKFPVEIKQQESQKDASKIINIKQEHDAKSKLPKHSTTPFDQTTKNEYKQKNILFKMMMASKSYSKHPAHKALYDDLIQSLFMDEDDNDRVVVDPPIQTKKRHDDKDQDPFARSDQGKKKKRPRTKYDEPSKNILHPRNLLKNVANDADQPQDDYAPREDNSTWFKQPPRPETPNPDWNTVKAADVGPEQTLFNEIVNDKKPPFTFDELMSTPIDFTTFAMNRLKLDKITRADLVGLIFNLLKGTCKSYVESEYNMEECYRALTDQLEWTNPEGHKCLVDMSKHLPLQDKEGIKARNTEREYFSSITKILAASVKVKKRFGYGYLEEIIVRRADQNLYKFKDGNFPRLHLNEIEDMLLLLNQHKLFNLDKDVIVDLGVALRISVKELYTPNFDPKGVIYEDKQNHKRLMCNNELYKFRNGTLTLARKTLHYKLLNFWIGYNDDMPKRKWNWVNTYAIRNTKMLSGIEDRHHGPSDAKHNPP
ncbi:hypothetical protein Tco_0589283 [Tanacetum coccineum]